MTPTQEDVDAAEDMLSDRFGFETTDQHLERLSQAFMRHRLAAEERGKRMALDKAARVLFDKRRHLAARDIAAIQDLDFTAIRQIDPASLGAE